MNITTNNYEQYLVDYLDNRLNPDERKQVEAFLLLHPNIREEFELISHSLETDTTTSFKNKDSLKQIPFEQTPANDKTFEYWCIDKLEGNMPKDSLSRFNKALEKAEEKKIKYSQFEKTRLPLENIFFNEGLFLKKENFEHTVTEQNFEQYAVACHEGWLDQPGLVALNVFLSENRAYRETFDLFAKTKLKPQGSEVFPNKNSLKKYRLLSARNKRLAIYAAAAVIALLINFWYVNTNQPEQNQQLSTTVVQPEIKQAGEINQPTIQEQNIVETNRHTPANVITKPAKVNKTQTPVQQKWDDFQVKYLNPKSPKLLQTNLQKAIDTNYILNPLNGAFSPAFNKEPYAQSNAAKKIDLWQVTQAGIKGFNKVTQSNMQLKRKTQEGKTTIVFKSDLLSFKTKVKNRKNI